MVDSWSYNEIKFKENKRYDIGFNSGVEFRKVKYVGTKLFNGKSMLCFKTLEDVDLTVNLSYISFIVREHENKETGEDTWVS